MANAISQRAEINLHNGGEHFKRDPIGSGILPAPKAKKRKPKKKKGRTAGEESVISPEGEASTVMSEEDTQADDEQFIESTTADETELANEPSISPSEGAPGEVPNIAQATSLQSTTLKPWCTGLDWATAVDEDDGDDSWMSEQLEKWGIRTNAA